MLTRAPLASLPAAADDTVAAPRTTTGPRATRTVPGTAVVAASAAGWLIGSVRAATPGASTGPSRQRRRAVGGMGGPPVAGDGGGKWGSGDTRTSRPSH